YRIEESKFSSISSNSKQQHIFINRGVSRVKLQRAAEIHFKQQTQLVAIDVSREEKNKFNSIAAACKKKTTSQL
ncbi:hypothetical protein ACLOJK_024223, partial [Asimina triloba]